MDFTIGLLLFAFTLVVYFSYINNFQQEEKSNVNDLVKDATAISSSLSLSGYPTDWNNITVIRIGISDDSNVNATKLKSFRQLDYKLTRKKFATFYDYFIFFVNNNGDVLNIGGVCGVGHNLITTTYNIKSAYYYQDPPNSFLKDYMNQSFKADIYFGNQLSQLISNLSKYYLLVMEQPLMSTSDYNNYKSQLQNYSSAGGFLLVSGGVTATQGNDLDGVAFFKKAGQSITDRNSTINSTDPYLTLNKEDQIVFAQAYYADNSSSTQANGFVPIATFNQDGKNAVAKWQYGNGTIYFFSSIDTSSFNGNFISIVQYLAGGLAEGTCNPINLSAVNYNKLVKTERYLTYNSTIIKMRVYVWQ